MRYEYECPGCGDVREIERKMTDPRRNYYVQQLPQPVPT
jgi:hypothetical protein